MRPRATLPNCVLENEAVLPTTQGIARLYQHSCGAKIMWVQRPNRLMGFTIGVPTPPTNDLGLPHLLEHLVLKGSERYFEEEPFFRLMGASANICMQAVTGEDMTFFSASSIIDRDIVNLFDVYLDLVFRPILRLTDLRSEVGTAACPGPILSELFGIDRDPRRALHRALSSALFAGTAGAFDSCGYPGVLSSLPQKPLHDLLVTFHRCHYRIAQTSFVLHTSSPPTKLLGQLDDLIDRCGGGGEARPRPKVPDLPSRGIRCGVTARCLGGAEGFCDRLKHSGGRN